ncbi:MAG: TetR/AcrR family transcriptional regulator [Microbacteriaceae bacterium]|nr:TetR/AcrR family transcriptional regulator [Microbacteriaceae bacterium]
MTSRSQNARGTGEHLRSELVSAASAMLTSPQSMPLPSLRAVARACGVSPSAVYLHFDSQLALVRAVVDAQLASLREHVLGHPHDESDRGRLVAIATGYARWAMTHPGAYQLVFETAPHVGIVAHENPADDLIDLLGDLLATAQGSTAESAAADALVLWAGVHGMVLLRMHKPHLEWPRTVEDDVARLVDAVLAPVV